MGDFFNPNQHTPHRDIVHSKPPGRKKDQPLSRLQHYPSLPNIWIPPHSAPMATQIPNKTGQTTSVTPSAPSSPKSFSQVPAVEEITSTSARHMKNASLETTLRKSAKKTHTRRKTERDQPHNLLTPPLTPSSSIRTTGSSDIALKNNLEAGYPNITPFDPDSTRLLLVGNLYRQVTAPHFQTVLLDAINAYEHPTFKRKYDKPCDIMSAVNNRRLVSDGVLLILFYDTRVAKIAEEVILKAPTTEILQCTQGFNVEGNTTQIACHFMSMDSAEEMFGPSLTLDKADASFVLSIELSSTDYGNDSAELSLISMGPQNAKCDREAVPSTAPNISLLLALLQSVGDIRMFTRRLKNVDKTASASPLPSATVPSTHDKTPQPVYIFDVEYFNVADSVKACSELHGLTISGMCLGFIGTRFINASLDQNRHSALDGDASTENQNTPAIGPPGMLSDIRRRFDFHDLKSEKSDLASMVHPPSIGPESPPYFYNTTGVGLSSSPGPYEFAEGFVHTTQQPTYPNYSAVPLSNSPATVSQGPFLPHLSTPLYYATQPTVCPFPLPNFHRVEPHPLPPLPSLSQQCPLDAMIAGPQALMASWSYDPAIAAMSGPVLPMPGMIGGPNHFYPGDYVGVNGPYYPPPLHYKGTRDVVADLNGLVLQHYPDHFAPPPSVTAPRGLSPSPPSTVRNTHISVAPQGHRSTENNQLDLAKIEAGGDTRTTVMIKNIPNKMSDKNLEDYIAQVCPRQIDFLYLRIDFSNGCNVGYAFVNFITVTSLLNFAKARLGAKWNMFSSEKVLQMTYANYQGKESCIEKFKNSCIMDEKPAWRPRIYYSSGPDQGLPEPFPAPTHFRRKERSSHNRGALYVPGVNSSGFNHASGDLFHGGLVQQRRGPWFAQNRRRDGLGRHGASNINEGKLGC